MTILVTGCAGFIGSNLTERLIGEGHLVVGIDNMADNYDPKIKEDNLKGFSKSPKFRFYKQDIINFEEIDKIFRKEKPEVVIHLAARTGVRPSLLNPNLYTEVNVLGTVNLLKVSTEFEAQRFIFASSSSVYGNSKRIPFSEDDPCERIISPYGASKRAAEFFVESFWQTYKLRSAVLRLFTVYGRKGRPDMAPAIFTRAILDGKEIRQFGNGSTIRDYTYIDDIVEGFLKVLDKSFDFEIINLGNSKPVSLTDFIGTLEDVIGDKAKIKELPKQAGDVEKTWANIVKAKNILGWQPKTGIREGLEKYIKWLSAS